MVPTHTRYRLNTAIMVSAIITDIILVSATMAGAVSLIITVSIAAMIATIAGAATMIQIAGIIVRATYGNM